MVLPDTRISHFFEFRAVKVMLDRYTAIGIRGLVFKNGR